MTDAVVGTLHDRLREIDRDAGPRVGFDSQLDAATCRAALPAVLTLIEAAQRFAEFSAHNVDEHGWKDGKHGCHKERIVDWFGPSEFRALAEAVEAFVAQPKGEQ